MKYAFVIMHTDIPVDVINDVQDVFVLDLDEQSMIKLQNEIDIKFLHHGVGNDEQWSLMVTPLEVTTIQKLRKHVDGLVAEDEDPDPCECDECDEG